MRRLHLRAHSSCITVTLAPSSPALLPLMRSIGPRNIGIKHVEYHGSVQVLAVGPNGITVELLDDVTPEPTTRHLTYAGLRALHLPA